MKQRVVLSITCWLLSVVAFGQPVAPPSRVASGDTVAPDIPGVVKGGTKVEIIKRDFEVPINGPVALPDGSGVVFTEILKSRVWKADQHNNVTVFLENSNGALCLAFDAKGRLIANQTMPAARNKIAVIYPKGQEAILSEDFEGKAFGRPNDLVVDKKGGVYFTEPGPNEGQIKLGHPVTQPAVYYVPPGGKAMKVIEGVERPNGLQLSTDERTFYLANSAGDFILAFDVQTDGRLRNQRNFAKLEHGKEADADGLTIDRDGRVYVSARGGVQVFSSRGEHLGTIPAGGPGNVAFGGPDKRTLYITSGTALSRVQMIAQGYAGRAK